MKIHPLLSLRGLSSLLNRDSQGKSAFFFAPGDTVEAKILQKMGDGKYLMLIRDQKLVADSDVPLLRGESKIFRVMQVHPKIVLRSIGNSGSMPSALANCVSFYHSNPKALSDFFMAARELLAGTNLKEMSACIGKQDTEEFQKLIASLLFSEKNLQSGFLKDFLRHAGYFMESELKESLEKGFFRKARVTKASRNLKGFLQKIIQKLNGLQTEERNASVVKFKGFFQSGLKMIESQQIVNALAAEKEHTFLFQIPLLFPAAVGSVHVCIPWGDEDSQEKGKKRQPGTLVLFMQMDALGDIRIDVRIVDGKLTCCFTCRDENIAGFITPFFVELQRGLKECGYCLDSLQCRVDREFSNTFQAGKVCEGLFPDDSIDVRT